ncbi:hypothetical protein EGT51_05860 [Levilactobacillus suantsaiihabitans]|uniref:Uncharacterized protein n=1 Tax=Levilactobacillus suantsaiihabitans TaxID=2487722 RepID=A0A4Z0JA80_9LACO|nr:hypothetical protein EGT51_05860 [Levilactobacillus suantsaiihabitans]
MASSGSVVLAEVLSQPTARDDLRDWRVFPGFQANRKPAFQAEGVPQSRPHPSLMQAPGFTNFRCRNTVVTAISALILGSTFSSQFHSCKKAAPADDLS